MNEITISELEPPQPPSLPASWLGAMAGTVEVVGDIVGAPAEAENAWEALRDRGSCSTRT